MDINLFLDAANYAAEKHKYQRRKGFNQVPYINHPFKVAKVLAECGDTHIDLLIAALLHDVVEDTDASEEEIRERFGKGVSDLIMEVTDDKELPFAVRKDLQVKHAPSLSDNAKRLKIADKICNINDILNYPLDWSTERKLSYLDWAKAVVSGCRNINPALDKLFDETVDDGFVKLENEI